MGFTRGVANPCCFRHKEKNLTLVVHGDDFTCVGPPDALSWYEQKMKDSFEIKLRGRMGEAPHLEKGNEDFESCGTS